MLLSGEHVCEQGRDILYAVLGGHHRLERIAGQHHIAEVLGVFENPPFDWGDRSAWRLFNAITYALEGRIAENPAATRTLHDVIDGICEAA